MSSLLGVTEEEFKRQIEAAPMLKPTYAPPINKDRDPMEVCISGAKKIEKDSDLSELLKKVYQGK